MHFSKKKISNQSPLLLTKLWSNDEWNSAPGPPGRCGDQAIAAGLAWHQDVARHVAAQLLRVDGGGERVVFRHPLAGGDVGPAKDAVGQGAVARFQVRRVAVARRFFRGGQSGGHGGGQHQRCEREHDCGRCWKARTFMLANYHQRRKPPRMKRELSRARDYVCALLWRFFFQTVCLWKLTLMLREYNYCLWECEMIRGCRWIRAWKVTLPGKWLST